ncbi:MAG: hypothetical protein M1837_002635 [Sclerophora amabilis]|nr:MAG: hypothetical protein M1837_002635 [Sclerophora amabilis]
MSQEKIVEGLLAINKPQGISSAQALRDLQTHFNPSRLFAPWLAAEKDRRFQESKHQRKRRRDKRSPQVKIGHGGTLDPLATGVLIAGIGRGTKRLQSFLTCTKTYEAVVLFGVATDSYDRLGKVLARAPYKHLTREMVAESLEKFRGKIMQRPPIFSALRVQGKKLYEYAREGKEVPIEIQERPVEVLNLELVQWMEGGTHEHRWPVEEAPGEEKAVADKVLHMKTEQSPEDVPSRQTSGTKRELEIPENDDLFSSPPSAKRPRQSSVPSEPLMSGGLGSPPPPPPPPPSPPAHPNPNPSSPTSNSPQNTTDDTSPPQPPAALLRLTSTSGFYVRSLCHDLGASLGSLAVMAELVRTRQGDFELGQNVLEYDDLEHGEDVWGPKVTALLEKSNDVGSEERTRRSVSEDGDGGG